MTSPILQDNEKVAAGPNAKSEGALKLEAPRKKTGRARRKALLVLCTVLTGTAWLAYEGYAYVKVGRFTQSTDNAYVKTDFTTIAPKVSGYVAKILVRDNETVEMGQVLARIDDRDFQLSLLQARADVSAAEATVANAEAQIVLQHSLIDQARASLSVSKSSHFYAVSEAKRSAKLNKEGVGSLSKAEQGKSLEDQAKASVARDEAAVVAAESRIPVLSTQRDQAVAQLNRARALVRQKETDLSYTQIVSPINGTVGAKTIRLGQYVAAGTQLMAVVPLSSAYVVANLKETELTYVEPGQDVEIEVDALPGAVVEGRVDSIAPASGLEFSLLPTDNATGNFTKIVQRIPVKIVLNSGPSISSLRSGMSVVPKIDIRLAKTRQEAAVTNQR
ncbi:MAG: HlyD family secretion protein [Pseudorhizobium pelagicum]|uniref:HlyD family secretion protein n=1 Tax=Pseudorhizobium pelagicum TaxID=1509405 RepID=UPI003460B0F4